MRVEDLTDRLMRHPRRQYGTRGLGAIRGVVVHHTTGSEQSSGTSVEAIARYHVGQLDWPGIGYHFFIDVGGQVYQVNRLEAVSWHCGHPNGSTVGVVLRGDFTDHPPEAAQLRSLAELLADLLSRPDLAIERIAGHGQYPGATPTACPGATWPTWLPAAIEQAKGAAGELQEKPADPEPGEGPLYRPGAVVHTARRFVVGPGCLARVVAVTPTHYRLAFEMWVDRPYVEGAD